MPEASSGATSSNSFARGDTVRGFSRGDYRELREIGAETIRGDIQDAAAVAAACQNMDAVIHAAAIAGIWGPWQEFHGINTIGTRNVIAGCHAAGVSKLVYCSSPSVTFDGEDQAGVDESAPYASRWLCHYPHTKALGEQEILAANGHQGLATCALRPHLIWGPRDAHLIPRLIERARNNQLRMVGNGDNLVDITYVENAAAAHIQAVDALSLDSAVSGKAYFISQGEPVNLWDWINDVLGLAKLPPVTKRISRSAAWNAGAMLELAHRLFRINREPRMTRFLAAQLATSHYFDIGAAQQDFGYQPTISTQEAMSRLAETVR